MPQVQRDSSKPFYTARIKIDDADRFLEIAHKLRYFSFMGLPCRALPYQADLLGSNVVRLSDQNIFVRKIPKTVHAEGLEKHFSRFGDIISCKVSLNEDHTSRGYGFVCFKDPESAAQALRETEKSDEF